MESGGDLAVEGLRSALEKRRAAAVAYLMSGSDGDDLARVMDRLRKRTELDEAERALRRARCDLDAALLGDP